MEVQESSTPVCGDSPSARETGEFAAADTVALTANPAQTPPQESESRMWVVTVDPAGEIRAAGDATDPELGHPLGWKPVEVVPRSEAEALAEALEAHRTAIVMSVRNEYDVGDVDETLWAALDTYRSRHPKPSLEDDLVALNEAAKHVPPDVDVLAEMSRGEPCEWCRGRGVYACEDIETGRRNALECHRCKGTGNEPYKAGETP